MGSPATLLLVGKVLPPPGVELLRREWAVAGAELAALAAYLWDAVAATAALLRAALHQVQVLAATQELEVLARMVLALLVLVVAVVAVVAGFSVQLLVEPNFGFTKLVPVVVVELGYWEVAQTEPEVLGPMGVSEAAVAAEVLLEAMAGLMHQLEHLLGVLAVYMVQVVVLAGGTVIIAPAF